MKFWRLTPTSAEQCRAPMIQLLDRAHAAEGSLNPRSPGWFLASAFGLTGLVCLGLGWNALVSQRSHAFNQERSSRIQELRGIIVHLDEVLTMSARMAAVTGDARWEQRYRLFEPQLNAAIKETVRFDSDPSIGRAAQETDAANLELMEMEDRAFDLVRAGNASEARAVLFSPAYEEEKQVYADGMTRLMAALMNRLASADRTEQFRGNLSLIGALATFVLLAGVWLSVTQRLRRWNSELNAAVTNRAAALVASETKYRRLFESSRDALMTVCPPDWKFASANLATVELFGAKDEEEFTARGPWEVSPERQPDGELSVTKTLRMIATALEKGSHFFDWTHQKFGGAAFPATVLLTRVELDGQVGLQATVRDVTEQKRAEEALRESESRFRQLAESLPQLVWTCQPDGPCDYLSRQWVEFTGVPEAQQLGFGWLDQIHPDDRDRLTRAWNAAVATGGVFEIEFRIRRRDGAYRWFDTRAVPLRDGSGTIVKWFGSNTDMTERRQAAESQALLTTAIEQAAEAIVITDTDGRIEYVNPSFERMTGYTCAEALGKNPRILKSGKQDAEMYRAMWATLTRGETWKGHFTNKRKDGSLFEQESVISPVRDASDHIVNYVAVHRDVTQEREIQEQLRQSQKMEAVGRLAAGIAHEINTPIQFIGDNTRFLETAFSDLQRLLVLCRALVATTNDNGVDPELVVQARAAAETADVEYLSEEIPNAICQTLDGVARVSQIVTAMKDFSHPGGKEKEAVDLNRAIQSTVAVSRNEWKYVADLETELDPNLPLVPCLAGEINGVVLNIIVNAAHAIAEAKTANPETVGKIKITTRHDADWVEIRISDTGTGIPEEIRSKIFDPFFTTKEVGRGTGQGLAIAHTLIKDKHGGAIQVDTEVGVGSTFIIRLPLSKGTAIDEERESRPATDSALPAPSVSRTHRRDERDPQSGTTGTGIHVKGAA